MSRGALPKSLIAEFLGKTYEDVTDLIQRDGLPAISIAGKTKPSMKVMFVAFHRWLSANSVNEPMTEAELDRELDRAELRLRTKQRAMRAKREEAA